jgi:hypothetical protein
MSERKEVPIGIVVFLTFIVILDVLFLINLGNSLLSMSNDYTLFLSLTLDSIVLWIDVLLTLLSLIIIPYGFMKRKNSARIFALVFLSWSLFRTILYIITTSEKTIGFLFFTLFVVSMMYLLLSSVKRYFGKIITAIIPAEVIKEYTYGLYTLYTELVHLRNGKNQVIYFFSKRTPKSGTPTTLPDGYQVKESKRSGLPYLKKGDD